jgi:hypothetical protein
MPPFVLRARREVLEQLHHAALGLGEVSVVRVGGSPQLALFVVEIGVLLPLASKIPTH